MVDFLLYVVLLFVFFFVVYFVSMLLQKKRVTSQGALICLAASLALGFYGTVFHPHNEKALNEYLSEYSKSEIDDYICRNYSFHDIVDIYGKDELMFYLYDHPELIEQFYGD